MAYRNKVTSENVWAKCYSPSEHGHTRQWLSHILQPVSTWSHQVMVGPYSIARLNMVISGNCWAIFYSPSQHGYIRQNVDNTQQHIHYIIISEDIWAIPYTLSYYMVTSGNVWAIF
ncbi:hypothetical protein PoB_001153300 [Plakobranchus ocellatus]|uniref:Uncharacterized protein n=1 Tax=Plakobranchus ocellatus TaxID=259542 RepID=A0AAV3YRV6_9GAST|nr:hypothetical protein PoB_001153300 [Plakobranchus ocellatus]